MSAGLTKTIRRGSESKRKRLTEEDVGSRFKEWTGMDFASSTRQAKKGIVLVIGGAKGPCKIMG